MTEKQQHEESSTAYAPYVADSGFMKARIDTQPLVNELKITLTGRLETFVYDQDGNITRHVEQIAEPPVNSKGYHRIMQYFSFIVNPQTVQGYIKKEEYYNDYIAQKRTELADMLFDNMLEWDIKDEDYGILVDSIMNIVKLFVTRLLENTERQSYGTVKITQNESVHQRHGWRV